MKWKLSESLNTDDKDGTLPLTDDYETEKVFANVAGREAQDRSAQVSYYN